MPISREVIKAKIKTKLDSMRLLEEDVNSEDFFAELILILLDELLTSATITGVCPPGGGALTEGKIT
jgi:hypothetical protein